MTTIAVTGATGNLGGLVIDHLLTMGVKAEDVVPLVRSVNKGESFHIRGMKPRVASYDNSSEFEQAMKGIDKLVLISPPILDNAKRLHMLHETVMAVHAAKIEHLALVSLADPEERPFRLEDVDLAIEHTVLALGIPSTILRNSVYFDELTTELSVAAKSGELVSATKNHTLNWAPRADQAAAIAAAVVGDSHIGKIYNLVSPVAYTYDDVASMLSKATGRLIKHRQVEPGEAVQTLVAAGVDPVYAYSIVHDFQKAIATGKCHTTGSNIKQLSGKSGQPTAEYFTTLLDCVEK
jgi:NAD(P)H dehydrogenase (quinone)